MPVSDARQLYHLQDLHPTLDLENYKGKVTEWLDNEPVAAEVKRQFRKFLRTFRDEHGDKYYTRVIENMVLGELYHMMVPDGCHKSSCGNKQGATAAESNPWLVDMLPPQALTAQRTACVVRHCKGPAKACFCYLVINKLTLSMYLF